MSQPRFHEPGHHTAYGGVLSYRLDKVAQFGGISGAWLDVGCADGYYTVALAEAGASRVVGLEIDAGTLAKAKAAEHSASVSYMVGEAEQLPFDDHEFDGVLLNEVLEHVNDEARTLREVARVLRPGGRLALFSPNRWFPFEGHGARWSEERVLVGKPVLLMPWLPKRLTNRVATARNYWPRELVSLTTDAGLRVDHQGWALAQFEQYPWVPKPAISWYRDHLTQVEASRVARFFAVSTFIIASR
ncbi:MAG: class I SAM-dependent methyltransferase [Solirubrobacteraceae bacterium]